MLSNTPLEEKTDPRVQRTRALIMQAFRQLLPEKGFQSLTVQDITRQAGINRATFYAHFPDKVALLDTSIRLTFRQEIEKRTLNACQYSDANLRALIILVCEFVSSANERCTPPQAQFESLIESQVKKQLQELLQHWLAPIGAGADTRSAVTAASWAIYGLALQWSNDRSQDRPSKEAFADQVFPLIVGNLRGK